MKGAAVLLTLFGALLLGTICGADGQAVGAVGFASTTRVACQTASETLKTDSARESIRLTYNGVDTACWR